MSRFEFKLPDIGEGVTEGEIVGWLVKAGDPVVENQDMVEVMTDKATVTIGAPKAGTVVEMRGKEGDVVPVGSVLVVLDLPGGAAEAPPPKQKAARQAAPPPGGTSGAAAPVASAVGDLKDVLPGVPHSPRIVQDGYLNEKPLASPATRKLARELGLDLRRVRPTGEGGRVTREDVERQAPAEGGEQAAPRGGLAVHTAVTVRPTETEEVAAPDDGEAEGAKAGVAAAEPPAKPPGGERRVPIRGLRKRIYENMARAKRTAAHFTYVDECNVMELRGVKERAAPLAKEYGVQVTYLPFIVKAVVAGLRRHPALNCLVDDAAMELVIKDTFDIGIAVATDAGLTVPVLRGADGRSVVEIAREVERLATEARAGKTRREDLGGSSFTITSLGKQGGLFATPIVNYPEVAILGVHQIKKRPVVHEGQIVVGEVMLLSLSFDHRIVDGHMGAAFAQDVIAYLEAPERLLLEMR